MTKQTLFYLLILSFFSCQKEVKFYATNAAQIPAGITQEIPSKLLCGYNELRTKAINDSILSTD